MLNTNLSAQCVNTFKKRENVFQSNDRYSRSLLSFSSYYSMFFCEIGAEEKIDLPSVNIKEMNDNVPVLLLL